LQYNFFLQKSLKGLYQIEQGNALLINAKREKALKVRNNENDFALSALRFV